VIEVDRRSWRQPIRWQVADGRTGDRGDGRSFFLAAGAPPGPRRSRLLPARVVAYRNGS
jgi:hypothetical protein